eukprot:snap_masked-scaffold_17-processed-gene-6.38-mRNA-1 protein AED:0.12 eAED:0.13 QI:0/-1/0/1/-1/1/1/0/593
MEGFKALATQQGCSADGTTAINKNPMSSLISTIGKQSGAPNTANNAAAAAFARQRPSVAQTKQRNPINIQRPTHVSQSSASMQPIHHHQQPQQSSDWVNQFNNMSINQPQQPQHIPQQHFQQQPPQGFYQPFQAPMNMNMAPRINFAPPQMNQNQSYLPAKQVEVYGQQIEQQKPEVVQEAKKVEGNEAIRKATEDLVELMSKDDQFKNSKFYQQMEDVAKGKSVITDNEIIEGVETIDSPAVKNDRPYSGTSAQRIFEQAYQDQLNGKDVDFDKVFDTAFNYGNYAPQQENLKDKQYEMEKENPYVEQIKSEEDVDGMFEKGMELFNAGELKEAVFAFEAVVRADETNSEAWRMIGVTQQERDEDKKAIIALQRSIENDPYNLSALLALGVSYVNELDQTKALHTLKNWVERNPNFAGVQVEDIYGDSSGSDLMHDVMMLMSKVEEHSPNDPDVQEVLGVLFNVSREYERAANAFRKAINVKPNEYALWNKLGATLANFSKSKEAIPIYTRALELKPRYARGWLNYGISHSNLGEYRKAIRAYLRALELNPEAEHIWNYLRICVSCLPDQGDLLREADKRNIQAFQQAFNAV